MHYYAGALLLILLISELLTLSTGNSKNIGMLLRFVVLVGIKGCGGRRREGGVAGAGVSFEQGRHRVPDIEYHGSGGGTSGGGAEDQVGAADGAMEPPVAPASGGAAPPVHALPDGEHAKVAPRAEWPWHAVQCVWPSSEEMCYRCIFEEHVVQRRAAAALQLPGTPFEEAPSYQQRELLGSRQRRRHQLGCLL